MRYFFDTSVLVYLFDSGSPRKQSVARDLLEKHGLAGDMLLSTQVLQEFYVTVTRKFATAVSPGTAYQTVRDLATLPVVLVDAGMVLAAIRASQEQQLSFWDALIVRAALEGGAGVLYSEDFHHGLEIGGLRVENPFR